MKKYLLTGGIGLCVVALIAWYIFVYSDDATALFQGGAKTGLLQEIPNEFDQILYLRMDEDLKDVASQSNTITDKQTFSEIVDTLQELVIYQAIGEDDKTYNVLFLEGGEGFSIEQIEALGLLAGDEDYDSKNLGGGRWMYGNSEALSYVGGIKAGSITTNKEFKTFERAMRSGGHNVGFFSVPIDIDALETTTPFVSQFAEKLNYTYMVSTLRMDNPAGRVVLQFEDGTLSGGDDGFIPTILPQIKEKSLFYTEFSDVLSIFGASSSQVAALLPIMMGQIGAGSSLSSADISAVSEALNQNIALVVVPSGISPLGVGVRLVFEGEEVYPALRGIAPLLKQLLEGGLSQAGEIQEKETPNSLTYTFGGESEGSSGDLASGSLAPLELPLAQIVQGDGLTSLSLFTQLPLEIEDAGSRSFETTANTAMIFGWDAGLLQQSFLQAQINEQDTLGATSLFSKGVLKGYIDIVPDTQQVQIEFESIIDGE